MGNEKSLGHGPRVCARGEAVVSEEDEDLDSEFGILVVAQPDVETSRMLKIGLQAQPGVSTLICPVQNKVDGK